MFDPLGTEAAAIGCVTLQIVQDWVLKLNAHGPDGLIERKSGGMPSTNIFGAICPITGMAAGLVRPWCKPEAMGLHLQEFSALVTPGKHCARLTDQPWRVMSIGLRNWAQVT